MVDSLGHLYLYMFIQISSIKNLYFHFVTLSSIQFVFTIYLFISKFKIIILLFPRPILYLNIVIKL